MFFDASQEFLQRELASAKTKCTRLNQLFDSTHAEVVDLQKKFLGRDAAAKPIIEE